MKAVTTGRLQSLDFLRGVAILLVIFHHGHLLPALSRSGWMGVDLFFVLSGFLISGLLFREFLRFGEIRPLRFYLRRGFKIYPGFYLMIAVTVLVKWWLGAPVPPLSARRLIGEIAFIQNYVRGLWNHTWSLAVEEHFYFLLPLLFILILRWRRRAPDPFRSLVRIYLVTATVLLSGRTLYALLQPLFHHRWHFFPTHWRLDSLLFGVLLAYGYYFHNERLAATVRRWRRWVVGISCLAIFPCLFYWPADIFTHTVGFTLLALGFGGLLLVALFNDPGAVPAGSRNLVKSGAMLIEYIGLYSYSIYLWHLPLIEWLEPVLRSPSGHAHPNWYFFAYVVGAIGLGMGMAKVVEFPVLAVRDRWFPSRSGDFPGVKR